MFLLKIIFVFFLMDFCDVNHTSQALRRPAHPPHLRWTATAKCPNPQFKNGRFKLKQRSKIVRFACFTGYTLVGNRYATCENGQWDEPTPICVKPGCPLSEVKNALPIPSYNESWVVYYCLPGFDLVGSGTVYCDGTKWNASLPKCVATKVAPPLSCDFESPDICGWKQDVQHDFDWRRRKGSTPSSFLKTGPTFDHTLGGNNGTSLEGYYMYIESTSREINESARLISPIYDAGLAKDGCFSLYYHMYGKSMGGLRVIQKPENMSLLYMLLSPKEERDKYLLFEIWGNQLDYWYRNVTKLKYFNEDFQIVIEGIRGSSFLSDLAIDDVAILQGNSCVEAMKSAETPTVMISSCAGRCNLTGNLPPQRNIMLCTCDVYCIDKSTCCPDFMDVCFGLNDLDYSLEIDTPQTEKLVSERNMTSPKPTPKPSAAPPTTTTQKVTRSTKVVTTPKPVTTTKQIPMTSSTALPNLVFKSTTRIYNATGVITKDNKTIEVKKATTSAMKTTKAKVMTTTTVKPTTVVRKTTKKIDEVEKGKMEKERRLETQTQRIVLKEIKPTSSGANTAIAVLIGIALCACAAFLIYFARGARGREIIARVRGRVQRDSEVRYLNTHEDE